MTRRAGKSALLCAGSLLIVLGLNACQHVETSPPSRLLGDGDLIVIGRIDIVPPFTEKEQNLKGIGSGRLKNHGYLFLSDRFVNLSQLRVGSSKYSELVELGKHFVIKRKRFETLHYSGTLVMTQLSPSPEQASFPGNVVYKIRPEDRTVYIGTLRYYRDEYNDIKKVEYVDEYADALKEFRKSTGDAKMPLRKVLPERPK